MDELLPKATGHQARIAKRRTINQHRKEREVSPGKYKSIPVLLHWVMYDCIDIAESSLMGSRLALYTM